MSDSEKLTTRSKGFGSFLVVAYGILALAALGRSFIQITSRFEEAPLSYSLSAVSALVYIVALVALLLKGSFWHSVAWVAISFEMVGVLLIGTASIIWPDQFQHTTVWSLYGNGYGFFPLVLPMLGIWWLWKVGKNR
ncbi:MAG: hypothetical protein KF916_04875 [Microbacteriaceae bacterium]|nr:hypothetical protein [Microbacteriaceae bacterium]